jgi:hypothetical protein
VFIVGLVAPTLHPVLELPRGIVERSVDRCFGRVGGSRRGGMPDEQLVAGKVNVYRDVKSVPMTMMMARQLDHYVTRDDGVANALELLQAKPYVCG